MSTDNQEPNWGELSDEEILNAEAPPIGGASGEDTSGVDDSGPTQSDAEDDAKDATDGDTGGADDDQSSDTDSDDADDTSGSDKDDEDNQDPYSGDADDSPKDDQSEDKDEDDKSDAKDTDSDEVDWKAEYQKVMAPFKAAKREIQLENPEEARRLMQMGVDYSRKMQMMKPYQRILHTLEKANLLDPDRINFLIDLDNKDPEAIKKLLKDSSFDPTEHSLDEDSDDTYTPKNHAPSDKEMGVKEAFESISTSESFDKTVDIITKQWDQGSKNLLRDNPKWIPLINNHVADGTFDKVWGHVERERMLGNLVGLSDLDAYYQAGEAMAKAGKLADPQSQNDQSSAAGKDTQASAHGNGSPQTDSKKDLKRAASPTRGKPSSRGAKKVVDYGKLSDEEIEKMPLPSSL
jgi:hypothetical protein